MSTKTVGDVYKSIELALAANKDDTAAEAEMEAVQGEVVMAPVHPDQLHERIQAIIDLIALGQSLVTIGALVAKKLVRR